MAPIHGVDTAGIRLLRVGVWIFWSDGNRGGKSGARDRQLLGGSRRAALADNGHPLVVTAALHRVHRAPPTPRPPGSVSSRPPASASNGTTNQDETHRGSNP